MTFRSIELTDMTRLYFERQLLGAKTRVHHPVEVASSICGVNAQRGVTIYLAFWNRMHNLKKEDLDHALYRTRELVKIWCMRGTVHVVPSSQFRMYSAATTPFRLWAPDISDSLCEKVIKVLEEPLTKSEIVDRIQGKVDVPEKDLSSQIARSVRILGYKGIIVFADALGTGFYTREYKFALAENWLPSEPLLSEEEARQHLLLNYLDCYAPATIQDFAYWAGFKVGEARKVFDSIDKEEVKIGGRPYYVRAEDALDAKEDETDRIVLLPEYDSYIMGHKDKSRILKEEHRTQVLLPFASVAATVVKNGRVVGTWNMKKEKRTLLFQMNPFDEHEERDLSLIHEEVKRIARFMDLEYCINSDSF